MTAQFRLWDTASGEQIAGEQYTTDTVNGRRVAHMIADAVFTRVTGEKGFFDSRVVFVDETGPKEKRRKRLAIMDMDGANVKSARRRRRARRHAAVFAVRPAGRLHVVRRRRSKGDAARSREHAARVGGQFSRHDFRAPLLARRTANRDVALGRREHQSLHHGLALPRHHPSHREFGDRHVSDLFARRDADRIRVRPWRVAADLRDERRRRPGQAHFCSARATIRRRSGRRAATSSRSPGSRADPSASG